MTDFISTIISIAIACLVGYPIISWIEDIKKEKRDDDDRTK